MTLLTSSVGWGDPFTEAREAITQAQKALMAVKKAGYEWRLIDEVSGSHSVSLSRLLAIAKRRMASRDFPEAIRIARRVKQAAYLGIKQAMENESATPIYLFDTTP